MVESEHVSARYAQHVNPQWARLLGLLEMDVRYERCAGAELFTADGRRIVDFLSGYCVHNVGHNHPDVVEALQRELARCGPAMIQTHVADLAGELAERLCARAGGRLSKAFFASSGSEGVEAAIKFARAHTRRTAILAAEHAFHGLTCGALSLMSDEFWREGFGPLLPGVETVPFGALEPLERELKSKQFAAFIVEPIQSEAGVRVPDADYLRNVEALCRRYGTLFVLDEVQTGMYRTGTFLAAHQFGVEPDIVVLAKALSGGLVPVGAVLMSDEVCDSVYSSLPRAFVHTSTFGENSLAMRAGLATLEVLEHEGLGKRAIESGKYLRDQLTAGLREFEMVREIRGMGLLMGIEFKAPKQLRLRIPYEAFGAVHGGMFGQILVMRLFRDFGFLTQVCGNNFTVLKVAPPLVVEEVQMDAFVAAVRSVMELANSPGVFWSEALGLARRAFRS
ncbi:MAG TPA: aspartate aminotransferase family protein [Candidatus Sulfotelmatobacter sp.]|jgi:ornithine--oxo-acid transaminase|nr:aspartate aminotransferase family protein [Candidatus Sulfotelmatobacter sp.]